MTGDSRQSNLPARVAILGAARSGLAAARFLAGLGVDVFISDTCEPKRLEYVLAANALAHLPHEGGGHSQAVLDRDLIIVSPGIPANAPILDGARHAGVPVWSEIELAYRCSKAAICAVTGSTGKSTTVEMIGAIMRTQKKRQSVVGGNIGVPLIAVAPRIDESGIVIAEISSFQLEHVDQFKPRIAVLLNLHRNHLDRHADIEAYWNAKKAIAANCDDQCFVILNACDSHLRAWADVVGERTRIVFFGENIANAAAVWYEQGRILSSIDGTVQEILPVESMAVTGKHNWDNASAAAAAARCAGIGYEDIAAGLCAFQGLPHRLQFAGERDGVRYYNDSKSTTAESMRAAIEAFTGGVHLIAGGRDKGCDFSIVEDILASHVREAVLIGEAAPRIARQWEGKTDIVCKESLEAALETARRGARPGDVVVLSPGCSSFDMFENFECRGDEFMKIVERITAGGETVRI